GALPCLGRDHWPAASLYAAAQSARSRVALAVAPRLCNLYHSPSRAGNSGARLAVSSRASRAQIPCDGDRDLPRVLSAGGFDAEASWREPGPIGAFSCVQLRKKRGNEMRFSPAVFGATLVLAGFSFSTD